MKLSEHFTLEEMIFSQTAIRLGLNNTPTQDVIDNLRKLCVDILEPLRSFLNKPIIINSGFRNLELNRAIGSKDTSAHVRGLAADIVVKEFSPDQVVRAIIQSGLDYDQVILEFNQWTHVAIPKVGIEGRKQKLIIDSTGTRLFS